MTHLGHLREELTLNLNALVDAQQPALRHLIRETLAFDNIQDTVFYDIVLGRPRAVLNFFTAALQRQGRAVDVVKPSDSVLQSFKGNFTSSLLRQGLNQLGVESSDDSNELTSSFRVYLGQLRRRNIAVPANLRGLVAQERVDQSVADMTEELEFMSFLNDAVAGNHAVFRDVSFQQQSAWGLFIRDTLAGRETPGTQRVARDSRAVLQLRAEAGRLVEAGVLPALTQLIANSRQQRARPGRPADPQDGGTLDILVADDLQDPPELAKYPGFQPTGPSHPEKLSTDEDVVETNFWPHVRNDLSTHTGPRPCCLCFCSAELFVPELSSGDAS